MVQVSYTRPAAKPIKINKKKQAFQISTGLSPDLMGKKAGDTITPKTMAPKLKGKLKKKGLQTNYSN
jgi:hypothetical protein